MQKKPKILVIGDLMIDHYLWGDVNRVSPEAPVQVVQINKETIILGGAGNVINNLVALGSDVMVLSVVGNDQNATQITQMLEELKVKHYLIHDKNRKTTKKSRIIASAQQIVRYDHETIEPISQEAEALLSVGVLNIIDQFDVVLISDYGKGVITDTIVSKINFAALGSGSKVLVDPKGSNYTKYIGSYLLTPNKKEANEATGIKIVDDTTLKQALKILQKISCVKIPMITLSEDGIAILDEDDNLIKKPTVAKEVFDVTGAGDTVLASLGYCLAQGKDILSSIEFANLAAGVVVGKIGSATATLAEIEEYKSSLHKSSIESHIKDFTQIQTIVKRLKTQNKKIVFTNGCFDILHLGHVKYLQKARSLGDILIVGVNSNDSVSRLKGPTRPVNDEFDRAYLLASLEVVDYVVIFKEDTPYELIKKIKPDILVKGADYKDKKVVGSDIAKEVRLIDFVEGKSTTTIIERMKLC